LKIPLEKIREGTNLSKQKCLEHLDCAEILASNKLSSNAMIHLEFAIEEFGRSVAFNKNVKNGSVEVDNGIMRSHKRKYDEAWTVLPEKLKTVYEGSFDPAVFDPEVFDCKKETISPETRLDATFVNWDEKAQEWKNNIRADPEKIVAISKEIRASIGTITWY
jgi:hypothetical protein